LFDTIEQVKAALPPAPKATAKKKSKAKAKTTAQD
jgi:hypothetical protein